MKIRTIGDLVRELGRYDHSISICVVDDADDRNIAGFELGRWHLSAGVEERGYVTDREKEASKADVRRYFGLGKKGRLRWNLERVPMLKVLMKDTD